MPQMLICTSFLAIYFFSSSHVARFETYFCLEFSLNQWPFSPLTHPEKFILPTFWTMFYKFSFMLLNNDNCLHNENHTYLRYGNSHSPSINIILFSVSAGFLKTIRHFTYLQWTLVVQTIVNRFLQCFTEAKKNLLKAKNRASRFCFGHKDNII